MPSHEVFLPIYTIRITGIAGDDRYGDNFHNRFEAVWHALGLAETPDAAVRSIDVLEIAADRRALVYAVTPRPSAN